MTKSEDPAFFCDVCEAAFRIPIERFEKPGVTIPVACPTCGLQGNATRQPDGRIQIRHRKHIFVCPRPLVHNPLAVTLVYAGIVFPIILFSFAAVSLVVRAMLCPLVFLAALLATALIGGIQLAITGDLKKSYIELVRLFVKAMPRLLFRQRLPIGRIAELATETPSD
jgi:hypothetical protein